MNDGERGSGPEGADDLCCSYLSLKADIGASGLEFGPTGWYKSIEGAILALRQVKEAGI